MTYRISGRLLFEAPFSFWEGTGGRSQMEGTEPSKPDDGGLEGALIGAGATSAIASDSTGRHSLLQSSFVRAAVRYRVWSPASTRYASATASRGGPAR